LAGRKKQARKPMSRKPEETLARLIEAAETEFNAHGFHGTDTNRIARRAGYAPQTFYRHFTDKTAVFLAVYDRWWRAESGAIGKLLRARGRSGLGSVADTMIEFHVKWRGFRRSLRHLSVEEPRVRRARAAARKAQLETARELLPNSADRTPEIAASLLIFERLCDAAAEGEFADMGLPKAAARQAVIRALVALYDGSSGNP
jgi:AcrR family transcriptional regulator